MKRKLIHIQMEVEYPEIYKDEWAENEIRLDLEALIRGHNGESEEQALKGRAVTYYLNGCAWVDGRPMQKLA